MKKTKKTILGIIGLTLVVAMTVLAVLLPESGASALDTNPITDEVKVRVVGSVPMIKLTYPENDTIFVDPTQYFTFEYENVETTTTEVRYTDASGTEHIYTIDTVDPDYVPGTSEAYPLDLLGTDYGYGEYKIVTKGIGFDGVTAEDTIAFSFYPVYSTLTDGEGDGSYNLKLYYDEEAGDLAAIVVNVYDANGNLVEALSPAKVVPPADELNLAFAANELPSGEYTIEIVGVDSEGEELSAPYTIKLTYNEKKSDDDDGGDDSSDTKEDTPVAPGTGRFWGTGNISDSDILITALAVFVAAITVAVALIIRTKKDKATESK